MLTEMLTFIFFLGPVKSYFRITGARNATGMSPRDNVSPCKILQKYFSFMSFFWPGCEMCSLARALAQQ